MQLLKTRYCSLYSKQCSKFINCQELDKWSPEIQSTQLTLKVCLFGAIELAQNADPDKYTSSADAKEFDTTSLFLFPDFNQAKNVVIMAVIIVFQCILIIRKQKYQFLVKFQHKDYMVLQQVQKSKFLSIFQNHGKVQFQQHSL